jgi:hypothetical protein
VRLVPADIFPGLPEPLLLECLAAVFGLSAVRCRTGDPGRRALILAETLVIADEYAA